LTNHFCNINEKHLYIRVPYVFCTYSIRLIPRWLREIALKANIIRFISIVSGENLRFKGGEPVDCGLIRTKTQDALAQGQARMPRDADTYSNVTALNASNIFASSSGPFDAFERQSSNLRGGASSKDFLRVLDSLSLARDCLLILAAEGASSLLVRGAAPPFQSIQEVI